VCVLHRVKSLWREQWRLFTSMFTYSVQLLLRLSNWLPSTGWWTTMYWK